MKAFMLKTAGMTCYTRVALESGEVYNPTSGAYVKGTSWADSKITTVEESDGVYVAPIPDMARGTRFAYAIYKQLGESPATSDPILFGETRKFGV